MVTDIAVSSSWSESCRQLLELGRLRAARELIEARLEEDPGDIEAAGLRGVWLAMSGRAQAAEQLWRETLEAAKTDPLRLEHFGHLVAELGRDDLVGEIAQELGALCPQSAIGEYFEGRRAQILGDDDGAAREWERALEKDPSCQIARSALMHLLERLGRLDPALEHCGELLDQTGGSAELYSLRGRLLLRLERPGEARSSLEQARASGAQGLHPWLARCLRLEGRLEAALEILSESGAPRSPDTAEELALVLAALGRHEEAQRTAREASLEWPDHPALQWQAHRLGRTTPPDEAEPPAVLGGFMGRVRFDRRRDRPRVGCLPFSSLGQDGVNVALARGLAQILARALSPLWDARAIPFFKDRAGKEPFNFDFSPGYPDLLKWGRAAGAQVLVSGESYLFEECVLRFRVTHLERGEEIVTPELRGPRASLVSLVERGLKECAAALTRLGSPSSSEIVTSLGQEVSGTALLHYLLAAPPPTHSEARVRALLAAIQASRHFPWAERELTSEIEHLEEESRSELALETLAAFGAARTADVTLQQRLAESALGAGNPSLALVAYERCRDADPHVDLPTFTIAQLLHAEGRIDDAIAHYREATRRGLQTAESHGELAGLLARRGQADEAIEHWRRALQLEPDLTRYRLRLTEALLERGEVPGAEREVEKLKRARPAPPGLEALIRRLEAMK